MGIWIWDFLRNSPYTKCLSGQQWQLENNGVHNYGINAWGNLRFLKIFSIYQGLIGQQSHLENHGVHNYGMDAWSTLYTHCGSLKMMQFYGITHWYFSKSYIKAKGWTSSVVQQRLARLSLECGIWEWSTKWKWTKLG